MDDRLRHCPRTALAALLIAATGCDLLTGDGGGAGGAQPGGGWTTPEVLVAGADRPTTLGQDASALYWANAEGMLRFVSKTGGEVTTAAESAGFASDLVVADDAVYWLDQTQGRIWRFAITDALTELLAIGLATPLRLAQDDYYLYWGDENGYVMRLGRAGGYPELLAYGGIEPASIAVDQDRVYFADRQARTISAVPVVGGPVELLASGQIGVTSLAVDTTFLYWTTATSIVALDHTDPEADDVTLAPGLTEPDWIVAAGGYVYWSSAADGAVYRMSKTGGRPEALATGQSNPGKLVVDSVAVYWVNHGASPETGSVCRLARQ